MSDRLTPKQERFCQEYLIDLNGTQAAIRAGYSADSADVEGSRLLVNAKVAARIEELTAERSKRTEITQDQVLQELAKIAFYRGSRVLRVNEDGEVDVDYRGASAEDLDQILEVKRSVTKEGGSYSIKRFDKLAGLEKVGKHLGMFKDHTLVEFEDTKQRILEAVEGVCGDLYEMIPDERKAEASEAIARRLSGLDS